MQTALALKLALSLLKHAKTHTFTHMLVTFLLCFRSVWTRGSWDVYDMPGPLSLHVLGKTNRWSNFSTPCYMKYKCKVIWKFRRDLEEVLRESITLKWVLKFTQHSYKLSVRKQKHWKHVTKKYGGINTCSNNGDWFHPVTRWCMKGRKVTWTLVRHQ